MSQPARVPVCCLTPVDLGLEFEQVSLSGAEGARLAGWYIPSQNGAAVILLHGYGANRVEMLGRAAILAENGYGALLYDQRASGESGGELRSFGWLDVEDVPAALAYLAGRAEVEPGQVGILGFSQGGQIALRAAAQLDGLGAVVAEEPGFSTTQDLFPLRTLEERFIGLNYRLGLLGLAWRTGARDPGSVVAGLPEIAPRPVFLIAAGLPEDPGYRLVGYYYEQASEPKTWWEVPEAEHGQIPQLRPQEYAERVVGFFDAALSPVGE